MRRRRSWHEQGEGEKDAEDYRSENPRKGTAREEATLDSHVGPALQCTVDSVIVRPINGRTGHHPHVRQTGKFLCGLRRPAGARHVFDCQRFGVQAAAQQKILVRQNDPRAGATAVTAGGMGTAAAVASSL